MVRAIVLADVAYKQKCSDTVMFSTFNYVALTHICQLALELSDVPSGVSHVSPDVKVISN